MIFKIRNYTINPFIKFNLLQFFIVVITLLLFTTCKKQIQQNSTSSIKYFQGGTQDKVMSVIKTPDGGFLFIGYTLNGLNTDGFLLKVDGNGDQQWYKTYGGDKLEYFKNAIATSDGGYLAVGATTTETFDTINGFKMGYVVKTSSKGEILWEKKYGNKPTSFDDATENPSTKGFLITGSASINWPLVSLLSIDPSGNVIYNRLYTNGPFGNVPPLYINNLYAMYGNSVMFANDASGNVLLGGISSESDFTSGAQTGITHILSVGGNTGTPINFFYRMRDFSIYFGYFKVSFIRNYPKVKLLNAKNGYLVATYTFDSTYQFVMQLIKTDASANLVNPIWHKEYKGLGNTLFNDLNDNGDGTYLLTGASSVNFYDEAYPEYFKGLKAMIQKIDSDGNPIWTQYYGTDDNSNRAMCAQPSAKGGYAMAGYNSSDRVGYHKMFVLFIDNNGKIVQSK